MQKKLASRVFRFLVTFLIVGLSLSAQSGYYKLKMVRIMDEQGFGQPVEVARMLVPADWRTEGGVQWDSTQLRCPMNIVKIRFRAVAPDGVTGVEFAPGNMWTAASDPQMQQILSNQARMGTGCDVGPVAGAADYLRGAVVQRFRPGARVTGAQSLPEVTRAKQAQLAQFYEPMVRQGYVRGYKADAASIRISYSQNGKPVEEWLTTTVLSVAMPSANTAALMQGQVNMSAATYTMLADSVFSARAPEGNFDNKLAATITASVRSNPQYQAAINKFLSNMNNIAQKGVMDRARIWREAGQQISATITQTYQAQQAVQDRLASQFSQTIRGVETYFDPASGKNVELTGGYTNAWVNNRGEYLLSDSPGFDPGVALKEQWTPLKKTR
jgi:hypothetical protein